MTYPATSIWDELASPAQRDELVRLARRRGWGRSLALTGFLHLLAFTLCWYLTIRDYHGAAGYLTIWAAELIGVALIFRRGPAEPLPPTARFVARVWASYLLLAFNLCTMNALRGHDRFELFPAMASLASFGFLAMTFAVSRRFFPAVLVMFVSGLLMAAYPLHAYLTFAASWWAVLNGIGWAVVIGGRRPRPLAESQGAEENTPALSTR